MYVCVCVCVKVSGSKYIFFVLHVDDILLAVNDIDLLVETKHILFCHLYMKDLVTTKNTP